MWSPPSLNASSSPEQETQMSDVGVEEDTRVGPSPSLVSGDDTEKPKYHMARRL